ncbi:hypothetical protein ACWFMI_23665 [Nocardiopsis terrae]|uniref:hypothetical protein n=1 Tax=Streptomyces sp. NPDC057554 TaxID=3350538 RepID=UPI00367ACE75
MAPTRTKRRRKAPANYQPRFNAHSLGVLVDTTLMMAGPDELAHIEQAAARLDGDYSLKNRVALIVQCPGATVVAAKGTWRKAGYRIRTGQKGLAIWYRRTNRSKDDTDQSKDTPNPSPQPASDQAPQAESEAPTKRYSGFGINYVWDVSQMVPVDCQCTDTCTCQRPTIPEVTPAGLDDDGFSELMAAAAERTEGEAE